MNLEQKVKYLEVELTKARREAAKLRKKLGVANKHYRRVDQAYEDALLLATWKAAGIYPSRQYARKFGLTQNRIENAHGLLRLARILERNRHWTTDKLEVIEERLQKAKEKALESPDAYKARLNGHANS
jgi:hypothetical protein